MSNQQRFKYLLELYKDNVISIAEHDELFELISCNEFENQLTEAVEHDLMFGADNDMADLPPHIAHEIVRNIYKAEKHTSKFLPVKRKIAHLYTWIAAASVIVIAVSLSLVYNFTNHTTSTQFAALIPTNTITVKNTSKLPQLVTLSDGSKVTLASNSSLHYSRIFAGENRDVYLEGEAFFQVTKNPMKPFLVYYGNIVTKVLGTSFIVKMNAKTGKEEVDVRTGKVQVFENEKMLGFANKFDKALTILTPNQKAVYDEEAHLFENGLVEKPEKLLPNDTAAVVKSILVFEQDNLNKIFKKIQDNYGVEIVVESTNLYNCEFTGDVSNLDLFSVLQTICIATNSTYEVVGTKILVKGRGCN